MDSDERNPRTFRLREDTQLFFVERALCAMRNALERRGPKSAGDVSGVGSEGGCSHTDVPNRVWVHIREGIQSLAECVRLTIGTSKPYHLVPGVVRVAFTAMRARTPHESAQLGLCTECGDSLPSLKTTNGRGGRCRHCLPPPKERKPQVRALIAPPRKRRAPPTRKCTQCGTMHNRKFRWAVCSDACDAERSRDRDNARYKRDEGERADRTTPQHCRWCKAELPKPKRKGRQRLFCGRTCRDAKRNAKVAEERRWQTRVH